MRKIVLSNCREIERAKAVAAGTKRTEAQLDDMSRLHPNYVDFIMAGLQGRTIRERNARENIGLR